MGALRASGVIQNSSDVPNYLQGLLIRYALLAKVTDAGGGLVQVKSDFTYGRYGGANDLNYNYYFYFLCDGTETQLNISTMTRANAGIWKIQINGVDDSNGYDDYNAATAPIHRQITLTQPIKKGVNVVNLIAYSKNGASTGYQIMLVGASLQ